MTHRRKSALAAPIFLFLLAARAGTAQPARPPDTPQGPPEKPARSDAEAAAATGAQLRQLADRDEFSGVVLLAKNGKPFFHQAYGLANKDLGVLNRPDTKFNIGSINKMFTQVAIGQLLQQEKLALDDTILKHLPVYPGPAADRITIQQLLTNTSGLGDTFGDRYDVTPKDRLRELSDYLPLFAGDPLLFEPGTSRKYSNAGYVVLGLIIEKLSGQGYHDYVRQHIFAPAGMTGSDAYPQDAIVPNRAVGYTREGPKGPMPGPRRANLYALPARSSSAGGGYSTAADLLAFDRAIRGEKLLSPELTDWFLSDKSRPPAPAGSPRPGGRRSGGGAFAGGTAGVNAVLETDLDTGYTVVVLCNEDPPAALNVAKILRQRLGL